MGKVRSDQNKYIDVLSHRSPTENFIVWINTEHPDPGLLTSLNLVLLSPLVFHPCPSKFSENGSTEGKFILSDQDSD